MSDIKVEGYKVTNYYFCCVGKAETETTRVIIGLCDPGRTRASL